MRNYFFDIKQDNYVSNFNRWETLLIEIIKNSSKRITLPLKLIYKSILDEDEESF